MLMIKDAFKHKAAISISLKAVYKHLLIFFLFSFSAATPSLADAVILQYHHVSESTPPSTSLSPESFRVHMEYLQDNNFQILPLETVIKTLQDGRSITDKTAVITFDDAYLSVYTEAFPLLKEHNWPFTVFATTKLIGSNQALYSNWQQLNEMAESGATIANHTFSHPHLLQIELGETETDWLNRISEEITQAEDVIEQQTGQHHKILAYPYGEYNPAIQSLLKELGFIGIAQHSGPINADSDFTALPRFPFSGIYASMNTFPTKVNSMAFSLELISPISPITSLNSPSARLQFDVNEYRLDQLTCFNNNERIAVQALDQASRLYQISSHVNNQSRRFRYNCTAPSASGRYYWYSIQWINPDIPE